MKKENPKEEENVRVINVKYDDGESISCRTAPEKPFNGWPMPRD